MPNWGIRRVAVALLAIYVAAATAIVLWPTPVDGGLKSQLKDAIAAGHAAGLPQSVDYTAIESAANVVMFVPLGLLITLIAAHRFWFAAPLISIALSTSAEVAQLLFLPNRFPTLADVAANTSGALIGTLVVIAARGTLSAVAVAARRDSAHLAASLAPGRAPALALGTLTLTLADA